MVVWSHGLPACASYSRLSVTGSPDLPRNPTYTLEPAFPAAGPIIRLRHSVSQRCLASTGILTCCPSTTPFGLMLGPDLPWAESPGPGTLGFSVGRILTFLIATHFSSRSCDTSSAPCRCTFISIHNALLPLMIAHKSMASVNCFSPLTFSAQDH